MAAAEVQLEEWQESEEGQTSPIADHSKKFEEFCYVNDGKVGLPCGMDGGWQKRASGHIYSSKTDHIFCVGMQTGKVCGAVWFSKHCRLCEAVAKVNKDPPEHRCPRRKGETVQA